MSINTVPVFVNGNLPILFLIPCIVYYHVAFPACTNSCSLTSSSKQSTFTTPTSQTHQAPSTSYTDHWTRTDVAKLSVSKAQLLCSAMQLIAISCVVLYTYSTYRPYSIYMTRCNFFWLIVCTCMSVANVDTTNLD